MLMIETHGLSKTFKARQGEVQAVRGVDITVQQGEIFGFLGPNGAGKSTTMRMLATLLEPTSGQATVAGHDLKTQPAQVRTRIGYVGQAGGAEASATGYENVMLQARLYGLSQQAAHQRSMSLIETLQLTEFATRSVRTYSGGQRRRLDLAMGMVHQPALLFLDEPTTGLDPQSRAHLWEEVRKLRTNGTTVFLTTHYLEEADVLCDRLAIIDGGIIVAEGTPQALKRQIAGDIITLGLENDHTAQAHTLLSAQTFTREVETTDNTLRLYVERGEETLPQVLRLLDDAGLTIRTVTLARPTLDDVFLRQTGRTLRDTAG